MRRVKLLVPLIAMSMAVLQAATPAHAADSSPSSTVHHDVEVALHDLGLFTGHIDQSWDMRTRQSVCLWRELSGRTPSRALPTSEETEAILATAALTPPAGMTAGLNVNITCQGATWLIADHPGDQLRIKRVMRVSTGQPGRHDTRRGNFVVGWEVNGWHKSTLYNAMMYRPKYFSGGMALHGSESDALVKWFPDSHGCVRMLHRDIDALWKAGFSKGSPIRIYGKWSW